MSLVNKQQLKHHEFWKHEDMKAAIIMIIACKDGPLGTNKSSQYAEKRTNVKKDQNGSVLPDIMG